MGTVQQPHLFFCRQMVCRHRKDTLRNVIIYIRSEKGVSR